MAGCKSGDMPADPTYVQPPTGARPLATSAPLSEDQRTRVRRFWQAYEQATAARQAGQWESAAKKYQEALTIDPTHWDSLYNLGNCLMEQQRYEEAEAAYLRLAASDTKAARAYSALGCLYSTPAAGRLFNLEEAEKQYLKARGSNGDESGNVVRLGEVATARGQLAAAREYLEAGERTNPKSVSARFLLGYLAWKSGEAAAAGEHYASAIEQTKKQPPPQGVLGEGDTKRAGNAAMTLHSDRGLFDRFLPSLWTKRAGNVAAMNSIYKEVASYIASLPHRTT